jgi:hypothetical protein
LAPERRNLTRPDLFPPHEREPPTRYNRDRNQLPVHDPHWLPAQPQSLANRPVFSMTYRQRWQARNPYSTSLILVSRHFCSKKYVNSRLSAEQPHLSTPVHVVSFGEDKAMLVTATGKRNLKTLDHIIVACHTDNALCVLDAGSGTTSERSAGLRTMSGYIPTRVGVSFSSPLLSGKWWLILRLAS